ncbi:hypothetical protein EDC15_10612 [Acetobacter aceti NBRC 14818]|nr:hypothetical protein EDC15_10612 [Acetobacter aceti NBRC 14818]
MPSSQQSLFYATKCLKLLYTPALDSFRSSSFGRFILGHYFAFIDVELYTLVIVTMTFLSLKWETAANRQLPSFQKTASLKAFATSLPHDSV